MAGQLGADAQVRPALDQQFCHGQPPIAELRHGVKYRRLSANACWVDLRSRIGVRSAVKQELGSGDIPVFRSHVEQSPSSKCQSTVAGSAEIKLRKSPLYKHGVGIEIFGKAMDPVAQKVQ